MQRQSTWNPADAAPTAPLILLFERNDAVAVPLLGQLRMAGYDVRAARIPVEVFDLMQREPVVLVLVDLSNAAANRREFWVGLDTQRRGRNVHVLTFRYMATGETGTLDEGPRVARADVEIVSAQGFGPLIDAIRARVPGAKPTGQWEGPMLHPAPPIGTPPAPPRSVPPPSRGGVPGSAPPDASPFAQPYSDNPFKRRAFGASPAQQPPSTPRPAAPHPASAPWSPPAGAGFPPMPPLSRPATAPNSDHFAGFGSPSGSPPIPAPSARIVDDAWVPPQQVGTAPPPRRGVAYRGYDDEPLAPDDPRIEGHTAPIPATAFDDAPTSSHNERALSTILMDSAVISPQRLDALRGIQSTLQSVGINFSLAELAMLFKFLTPDQLLAAFLVSRGLVNPEQIASLGRIKQELLAAGKDYNLEALLVMFNILPADQVHRLRAELG